MNLYDRLTYSGSDDGLNHAAVVGRFIMQQDFILYGFSFFPAAVFLSPGVSD